MPRHVALSNSSYVILGLIALRGPSTPYELKTVVAETIAPFWSFPHAQIYLETNRLAELGHLHVHQEGDGRRKKTYDLTATGREALDRWLTDPDPGRRELRDPAFLKAFFGQLAAPSDIEALARRAAERHRSQLAAFEKVQERFEAEGRALVREVIGSDSDGEYLLATLRMGLVIEAVSAQFWQDLADRLASHEAPVKTRRKRVAPNAE